MKKFIIFLLCVAVLGGGGYFGYKKYEKDKKESIVVDVVPISMMMQYSDWFDYGNDTASGQVVASNTQRFYPDTQKLVKTVFVKEGQEVKKGDPILEYDMTVVELELKQKESAVNIVAHDIEMAKKELEKIRNYKPSEDAPKPEEPDDDDFDYHFGREDIEDMSLPDTDESSMPDDDSSIPDDDSSLPDTVPTLPPQLITDVIKPAFVPAEGVGTVVYPFVINCTRSTEVSKEFMARLASEKKCAEICVYDDSFHYLYKWIIVPTEETKISELENWKVSDGITIDEDGQASIDTDVKLYGKLSFTQPTTAKKEEESSLPDEVSSLPDESSSVPDMPDIPEDPGDFDIPEDDDVPSGYGHYTGSFGDQNSTDNDSENNDYIYSREAIKKMIAEKETDIKQLEIELKTAKFEFETAQKRRQDGKLYAEIDGIVKKIGKPADEESAESEEEPDEEDLYAEPSEDDKAFAVIQGEGGTEVRCDISELNLANVQKGAQLTVSSWNTGASGIAEVTSIDAEPTGYSSNNWGENPNNSTYTVHAKLEDDDGSFTIGEWVQVNIDKGSGTSSPSNSVYLPIHYVRQEGGDYYIMKADENGRLKKQYVKVGQTMYGLMIEVKGGLTSSDKICFPFGKDVKEGVKTRDTDTVLQPDNLDIF